MLVVWTRLVPGSHRSFFSRETDFVQRTGDSACTNLARPQFSHLVLSLIPMHLDKGAKLLPVGDFMVMTRRLIRTRLKISGFCFALQPEIDGVSTNVEQFTGFAFLQPIQFDGFDHLLAKIVAVGVWQNELDLIKNSQHTL